MSKLAACHAHGTVLMQMECLRGKLHKLGGEADAAAGLRLLRQQGFAALLRALAGCAAVGREPPRRVPHPALREQLRRAGACLTDEQRWLTPGNLQHPHRALCSKRVNIPIQAIGFAITSLRHSESCPQRCALLLARKAMPGSSGRRFSESASWSWTWPICCCSSCPQLISALQEMQHKQQNRMQMLLLPSAPSAWPWC